MRIRNIFIIFASVLFQACGSGAKSEAAEDNNLVDTEQAANQYSDLPPDTALYLTEDTMLDEAVLKKEILKQLKLKSAKSIESLTGAELLSIHQTFYKLLQQLPEEVGAAELTVWKSLFETLDQRSIALMNEGNTDVKAGIETARVKSDILTYFNSHRNH